MPDTAKEAIFRVLDKVNKPLIAAEIKDAYNAITGSLLEFSESNIERRLREMREGFCHPVTGKPIQIDSRTREGKNYSEWFIVKSTQGVLF